MFLMEFCFPAVWIRRLLPQLLKNIQKNADFEAATVLLKNSKKMGIPAMILAVLIAFSRLYLYVHYPTDVIVAIVLGIVIAFIGDFLAAKVAPALAPKKKGRFER